MITGVYGEIFISMIFDFNLNDDIISLKRSSNSKYYYP